MRPQNKDAVAVLRVHHVEEREASIGTRRGKQLKERLVAIVVGVSVARAVGKAPAKPRFQLAECLRLHARFDVSGDGSLGLDAPASGLHSAPENYIERGGR